MLTPLFLLLVYMTREFTSSVTLNRTSITRTNIFGSVTLKWSDISAVNLSSIVSALLLRDATGRTMRLPAFYGCRQELLECLRSYLPNTVDPQSLRIYEVN
jgi:hypothetical protein